LAYLGEESLDVLLRRSDEKLALFSFVVSADRLAQEVNALLDMRNDGLFW